MWRAHLRAFLIDLDKTVKSLLDYVRRYSDRPVVRPWALAVPLLVLVICLPLLRPLRHPGQISDDEKLRIATIRALVENRALALADGADLPDSNLIIERGGERFAAQPPMMSLLLALPAWVMQRFGISFDGNLMWYLLTLIGVTLPVAGAAGLVYRMGRLFELRRPWRVALAAVCVLGSGLLSYAVVLNPHAPAAVLVLCCAACLIQIAQLDRERARRGIAWIAIAGACAALAATFDPAAATLGVFFVFVVAALRFPLSLRALGVALYILGAAGPIVIHDMANRRITGDIFPAVLHEELLAHRAVAAPASGGGVEETEDLASPPEAFWTTLASYAGWVFTALLGAHGLFSHFPIVILGIAGVGAVMHRHWLPSTKTLAAATLVSAATIVTMYGIFRPDWRHAMYASRWFIVFTPMLVFWAGAWARRGHARTAWVVAGILVALSVIVSIIGATDPCPPAGFDRYTVAGAIRRMIGPRTPDNGAGDPRVVATHVHAGVP